MTDGASRDATPGLTSDDAGAAGRGADARARDERYGRRPGGRRARRGLALGAAVLAAVAVGWGAWVSHRLTSDAVTWQDVGFDVTGDAPTRVTFDVHFAPDLPAGARAVCTVRALNEVMAEVGLLDVTVGPASQRSVRATVEVPTSERAVTGLVKECVVKNG